MFNLNKDKPSHVPAKYIEMVLELTETKPLETVTVKDRSNGRSWQISYVHAVMFLLSSYKDYDENVRMIEVDEVKNSIFRYAQMRVFTGFFPYDQIILQTLGLAYEIYEDQSARLPQLINNEIFYICLVSEKDWPIIKPEIMRKGDVTLSYDRNK